MTCERETDDLKCVRPPKHDPPCWAYVLDEERRIEIVEFNPKG